MIVLANLLFALLFVLSAAINLAGMDKLWVFLDIPSLSIILLGIAGYVLLFGRQHFRRGVKTCFAMSYPPSEDNAETGRFFLHLAEFIILWGFIGMIFGIVLAMCDLDPTCIGPAIAVALLSPFYALGLSLFVFLPIGLRLSSPASLQLSGLWRLSVRQLLLALGIFFLLRCLAVIFALLIQSDFSLIGPIGAKEFGLVVQRAATVTHNPVDYQWGLFDHGIREIPIYIDLPTLIQVLGSWWIFRMASGKRRRGIAAPAIILMGLFWSIMGFVIMLTDIKPNLPDLFASGCVVAMLTTLYAFVAAIGFLIADMRSASKDGGVPPSSSAPLEDTEQAKEIIENVVARERR